MTNKINLEKYNLLPFDVEKAKAGAMVVTRDGTPVEFIAYVQDAFEDQQILCLINKSISHHFIDGATRTVYGRRPVVKTPYDLFIAEEKKEDIVVDVHELFVVFYPATLCKCEQEIYGDFEIVLDGKTGSFKDIRKKAK